MRTTQAVVPPDGGGACAPTHVCCAPLVRPRHEVPSNLRRVRAYLAAVYPQLSVDQASDLDITHLFWSRHWFYASSTGAPSLGPSLLEQLSLTKPTTHACTDDFFTGLLQRDVHSRFPHLLPCAPGVDCVRRQAAHMPQCATELSVRGSDVWAEVWHLAFDGRQVSPRKRPSRWSDFLDHGHSGWWYIHAPGSGIFYHAGRTLAAPSKAAMLASMLEEWSTTTEGKPAASAGAARSRDQQPATARTGAGHSARIDRTALRYIHRMTDRDPLALARRFRRLESGTTCHNMSWGRWRCVGDRIPSDNWDPLLITLGRALGYDSLYLSALMWGRALGSYQEIFDIQAGRPWWNAKRAADGSSAAMPQPLPPTTNVELTAEWVDLRLPPPPYDKTLLIPDALLDGPQREPLSVAWAQTIQTSSPARLSLRDPLDPTNDALARR